METTTGSVFWAVLWACIGGVFVLAGVLMEILAEKESFKNITSFRAWSRVKKIGEWTLVVGIAVEVIVAGIAAIHEWKNEPWNGQISEISADVYVDTKAPQLADMRASEKPSRVAFLMLCNASPQYPQAGSTLPLLVSHNFNPMFIPTTNVDSSISATYSLHLNTDGFSAWGTASGSVIPVKRFGDANFLCMQLSFLPEGTEILSGAVVVTVNGKVRRQFSVLRQFPIQQAPGWKNIVIATNAGTANLKFSP